MPPKADSFDAQEREIIQALRCCAESRLGREYPPHAELTAASAALLLGMHPAAARRLLRRALARIAQAIEADPELCRLVCAYFDTEEPQTPKNNI